MIQRIGAVLFRKSMLPHDMSEESALVYFLRQAGLDDTSKILDIGCGKGRNMHLLRRYGYRPDGVEICPFLVSEVRNGGFSCLTPSEFQKNANVYDAMLMSHIIEHFTPERLLNFMDGYFDRLSIGGYVIIATPVLTKAFYYDFDHVRPYYPLGIDLVFCIEDAQVQYQSRNRLERVGLCYRKGPYNGYFLGRAGISSAVVTIIGLFFYVISLRQMCMHTGWIGLYRKVGRKNTAESSQEKGLRS
jgi:SAM-dependent methyltransferase